MLTGKGIMRTNSKRALTFVGVWFGLVAVTDIMVGVWEPDQWAFLVAKGHCFLQGWHENELSPSSSHVSGWFIGRTASVTFTTKNVSPPKTIEVQLRKPVNMWPWRVTGYSETPAGP